MNIFNSYKRSRFFLWVNITGLAIGLAASILLILFVVNELSYDRHFDGYKRIVRLINVLEVNGETRHLPITLRKAYTEIPEKTPDIETATQIYNYGKRELVYETKRFQNTKTLLADSSFFRVFRMKFIEGSATKPFESTNSVIITRQYADIVFGKTEYTSMLAPFAVQFNGKAHGLVEKLSDIYLRSKADFSLGKSNNMKFVWLLTIIAMLTLLLAIINFINLFMAQSETRMNEIGIRKANGAGITDIIYQFFTEVFYIVLLAFVSGFFLAIMAAPYFAQIIRKEIDLSQLINPVFILCISGLFVITVTLSAGYPAFYMSRFSPLDILGKRLKFSKRRLTSVLIVLQSVITIILVSYILLINRQTVHLKNLPKNYTPENVMTVSSNQSLVKSYSSLRQELLNTPGIQQVSAAQHAVGGGASGQGIALLEDRENKKMINEYRIHPGLCELMGLQLIEGEYFKENQPDSIRQIILNEAALKLLGLSIPAIGKQVEYKGTAEIIGVVKDFIYEEPTDPVQPLVLTTYNSYPALIYIKFDKIIDRVKAQKLASGVFLRFDPEFVLNPTWNEDLYTAKFNNLNLQFKLVLIGSLISVFIAMIGLLAIHLYTAKRRTKEIGIRKINGANVQSIFTLLSWDIIKWIIIAGIIAVPPAYYIASAWLDNYANRMSLSWIIFVLPVLVQCLIALLVTSGVSLSVLSQNPVKSLKSE
jgi:putative ABC transport system permease protein